MCRGGGGGSLILNRGVVKVYGPIKARKGSFT